MTALLRGEGVLFLHGAGGRGLVWQHQLLAFPKAQAPDLPRRAGGHPAARPPWGVNRYLAAVRATVGPAASPRVVAGHSLGAAIALLWALTVPEEIRALILIGAGSRLRVAPHLLETLRADYEQGLEGLIGQWFAPRAPDRLKQKSRTLLRAVNPEMLLAELEAAEAFDVTADVGRIRVPSLLLCGADDQVTTAALSRDLHERMPGSYLVTIAGAGHMVMLERPRATNAAIRAFLARLEGPSQPRRTLR